MSEEWVNGLPPVGAECEAAWLELPDGGDRDFEAVFIKGVYGNQVWIATQSGEDIVSLAENCEFRPLKSKQERQREELCAIASKYSDLGRVIVDDILSRYTLEPKP